MSYKINKTNGDLLIDLVDGQIDETSTDITLIGRNYKGFGEKVNENFVKIVENFAKSSSPSSPLVGQLWYDTSEERLKIYTGDTFKSASGALVSQTQPNLVSGDLWIDSFNNKLYFYDGSDIVLVGPQYSAGQGKTIVEAATILDDTGQDQTVLYMYIAGLLTGIFSRTQFRPRVNITGYPVDATDVREPKRQLIRKGFNPIDTGFIYQGTAQSTQSLISDAGEAFTEANFMKTDRNTSTLGSLAVKNANGLTVGVSDTVYAALKVNNGYITVLEVQQSDKNFSLRTKRGSSFDDVLFVNTPIKRVGIYTNAPTVGFDVNTDMRVTGNTEIVGDLTVKGSATFVESTTLQVADKNIELSTVDGEAAGADAVADKGGITLRSTDGDKSFNWTIGTDSWTSSEHIDIPVSKAIKINGNTTLSNDRLHNTVLYAEGLVRLGTLQTLDVQQTNITGATITTANPMNLTSSGTITVNNQKIAGVASPVEADPDSTVTTKGYVDTEIKKEPVITSLDITGLTNPVALIITGGTPNSGPTASVQAILEQLYSAALKPAGTSAKVICTSYTGTTVSGIDVDQLVNDPDNPGGAQISAVKKSYISVYVDPDDSTTPELESVIQDIEFLPVNAAADLSPDRVLMTFTVTGSVWAWQSTNAI